MEFEDLENDEQELDDVLDHAYFNDRVEEIEEDQDDDLNGHSDYFRRINDL